MATTLTPPTEIDVYADWDRVFEWDFRDAAEIDVDGQTISSMTVTIDPSGPTVGTPTAGAGDNAGIVFCRVYGFTEDVRYTTHCAITTSAGRVLSLDGVLNCKPSGA